MPTIAMGYRSLGATRTIGPSYFLLLTSNIVLLQATARTRRAANTATMLMKIVK